jgi:hypothetical protein
VQGQTIGPTFSSRRFMMSLAIATKPSRPCFGFNTSRLPKCAIQSHCAVFIKITSLSRLLRITFPVRLSSEILSLPSPIGPQTLLHPCTVLYRHLGTDVRLGLSSKRSVRRPILSTLYHILILKIFTVAGRTFDKPYI